MKLQQIAAPFDDVDWIYEIKYDGFRALAYIENGACQLVSRNDKDFTRFKKLSANMPAEVEARTAILDGELVCLDTDGRSRFYDLMFNRAEPIFAAFDMLYLDGRDLRDKPLLERKCMLKAALVPSTRSFLYVQHIENRGKAMFETVCDMDDEGIVAKPKISPYRQVGGQSTWLKIKNPEYSQAEGRGDLFDQRK